MLHIKLVCNGQLISMKSREKFITFGRPNDEMQEVILSYFFSFFFLNRKISAISPSDFFSARDDDNPAEWIGIVPTIAHGCHESGTCPVIGALTTVSLRQSLCVSED